MLEVELPTPAIVDSGWYKDHPIVPASLMEAGLDQNQSVVSISQTGELITLSYFALIM